MDVNGSSEDYPVQNTEPEAAQEPVPETVPEAESEAAKELVPETVQEPERPENISPGRVLLILLIIAVIIEITAMISGSLIWRNRVYYPDHDCNDFDELFPDEGNAWEGVEYPSDDEVREAGVECTELGHFDIAAISLLDDLHDIFEDEGLEVEDIVNDSYNEVYEDGGSWYETLITFLLNVPGDDTDYQRVILNYDTATGALHEIDLFISDKDRMQSLVAALLKMLNERTLTFTDATFSEAMDTLARSVSRGENLYATYGSPQTSGYLTITLYCFEDGYSVYLARE